MKVLVDTGFIHAKELGRLAQVSKSMNTVATNEVVWESLCLKEFPFVKKFYKDSAEEKKYRNFYMRCTMPLSKRPRFERPKRLEKPRFKAEDLQIYVTIKYKEKVIHQRIISKKGLDYLLQSSMKTTFEKPIVLGKAQWDMDKIDYMQYGYHFAKNNGLPVTCDDFELGWGPDIRIDIVLVAKSQTGEEIVCPLFTSQDRLRDTHADILRVHPVMERNDYLELTSKTEFDLKKGQSSCMAFVEQPEVNPWHLRKTKQAAEIQKRLNNAPVLMGAYLHFAVVDKDRFALKAISIKALTSKKDGKNGLQKFCGVRDSSYDDRLSLLHILSEIDGEFRVNETSS